MSMSGKMKEAGIKAPTKAVTPKATTPVTAPRPEVKGSQSAAQAKSEAFKARGHALRENMTEEQKNAEGSKSGAVAFVACLGNPAVNKSRKTVDKGYINASQVVGYKFKALEAIEVPVAPLKAECKDILDVEPTGTMRAVAAGEEFNLNIVESAMLLAGTLFGGEVTGNGQRVFLSPVSSQTRKDPSPCLKKEGGSIKEVTIEIADMIGQVDGKGGTAKVKPEYEDAFGCLFRARKSTRGKGVSAKAAGESVKDTAAAFRALYGIN